MREIEFRGKRIDNGKWVVGDICHHDGVVSFIGQHPADGSMVVYDLYSETVGQFTGLLDKNGKKIFEGDVVSLEGWMPKEMQICFIEGAFCLANKKGEYVSDIHYIQHAGIKCAEIIGNIYDNPELLEVKR